MNIVLVCINNFQEYILDNIEVLSSLNHENIYVLTNRIFFEKFDKYNIHLVDIDELQDSHDFYSKSTLNKDFREGFWTLTSLRFFYIYEFMKVYNVANIIHIENDVLLYYNCDTIANHFDENKMYIPFDSYGRNIASILYIPSCHIFKIILDNYDFSKNDMENFKSIKDTTGLIEHFPIFNKDDNQDNCEISFVSKNFNQFQYIFDAAAIGQYLGGIDARNTDDGNICVGFINETCVVKYNEHAISWLNSNDNIMKPFIQIGDITVPIFNLHVHCKNLKKFIIYTETITI
jgi:hypothetical protein